MPLPFIFASLTGAEVSDLDANFSAAALLGVIPCSIVGTTVLQLTPLPQAPAIPAYQNYMVFGGIAPGTNAGATSARVDSIGFIPIYKDTGAGPTLLTGGEIIGNNLIALFYDSALQAGAGGFHLLTAPSAAAGTITAVTPGAGIAGGGSSGSVAVGLATIANLRLMANISGGVAAPTPQSLSAILDAIIGSTPYAVAQRGASAWGAAGGVVRGIAAAGTTQGTATQLTGAFNELTTAAATSGVILTTTIGLRQLVYNFGANTVNVYPPVGAQINGAGINTAVTLAAGAAAGYTMVGTTQAYSG